MIVYFSGTGNSRYCAQMLADRLGDESVDSFRFIREGGAAELLSDRPWVFVAPTYAWQLPRIFVEFIRKGSFSGSRDVYFIMTCGAEIGAAASANRALCEEKGLLCKGTLPVIMPENYIAMFNAPERAQALRIIDAARPALEEAVSCIREGRDFSAPRAGAMDKLKSGAVSDAFYRFFIKAKPFTVSNACISCGKCADACPLNNIRLLDGKPVWGSRCTHCMACICDCPVSAIEYGRSSRGKPRYQCPKYQS